MQIEHPLRQRAMETRNASAQRIEPGPRELGRQLELEAADRGADIDVVTRFKTKRSWCPNAAKLHVLRFRRADRHARVRQIRHGEQPFAQIGLNATELCFECLELVAETG